MLRIDFCLAVGLFCVSTGSVRAEALLQSDSRERFGEKDFAYFFIEAEDFETNDPRGAGASWLLSSDPSALFTTANEIDLDPLTGEPIEPDPGAFASGDESITNAVFSATVNNEVGGGHDVQYIVQFDAPGIYHLYIRQHSPVGLDLNRNQNDSFYYPVQFGPNPRQLKANGDDYGLLESMEYPDDTARRGPWVWFAARSVVQASEQNPPVDQNPFTFQEYEVTPEMVDEELILEFDHREDGAMLDAFLFVETSSGLPPTNGAGPDGLGFTGIGDAVDEEFGLSNLGTDTGPPPAEFRRGDCNDDGQMNITDAICILNWLFLGAQAPGCESAVNVDGSEAINITDAVGLLGFLFRGGPEPVAPYPSCGPASVPADESIGCETPPESCR